MSWVVWQLAKQLVYTMFNENNPASFHLWWKGNLVRHKKVSKYYGDDCLHNFLFYFYAFIKSRNLLYVSKKRPKTIFKVFQYQISTSVKRWEKHLASKANFSTSLLISCSNFKIKLCKRHWSDWKFQWNHVWRDLGWLELKNCSQRRSFTKYFRQTLVFTWDSKIQESFSFYFSAVIS